MPNGNETTAEVPAPAKVNVSLIVTGRRADGYHDLATIMAPVTIADDLKIKITDGRGVHLTCADPGVPADGRNLAARAAQVFCAAAQTAARVEIHLKKRVPVGAGLGGGSSDAAAVLKALNEMWGAPLSEDTLWRLARTLGSDVPFFLNRGWALATGRGEFITRVAGPAGTPLLLAAPRRSIPTPRVYQSLGETEYATDAGPIWDVLAALGEPAATWWAAGANSLEPPARRVFPLLNDLRGELAELGYENARLSGSGGAFVAPVEDPTRAARAVTALTTLGYWAEVTTTA